MTAPGPRLGTHFDNPVGFFQNLRIVIDQNHGVAVGNKIVHDPGQPHNVGRMQPDGRLVQHIENARCTVAHSAGKLHPLALTGRKCRGGTVKG